MTRAPFGGYVFWSAICMVPGTILYVAGSVAVTQLWTEGAVPWPIILLVAFIGIVPALTGRRLAGRLRLSHPDDSRTGERPKVADSLQERRDPAPATESPELEP